MGDYKRIVVLLLIMAGVTVTIGGAAIGILYDAAFEEERARLTETAQSQARFLEAVARHEMSEPDSVKNEWRAQTLAQIIDAHGEYGGFGETGEFTLAGREGNNIVFVLSHRHSDLEEPQPVPFDGKNAEPMRRALSGLSGTVIGLDYRGETVLAAHEPVTLLDLGIVAKIDLAEIREPFVRAGAMVALIGLFGIAAGTALFFGIGKSLVRRIRRSEALAKVSQARLMEYVESIPDGFSVFDSDLRLVICNQSYRDLYKEQADAIFPGARFEDFLRAGTVRGLYPLAVGREEEWIRQRIETCRGIGEKPIQRLVPSRHGWLQIHERRTSDGGVVSVRTNVTELKERELELEVARQQSEMANRAKTEFLANMSHELRTPLNSIIGFSDVLAGEMFGPMGKVEYRDYAKDINDSGQHLLGLITDILDVSRIETNALTLNEDEVNILELVESCERLIRERAEEAEVALSVTVDATLPRLNADERRLKQILLNLLSNSVKFTLGGGRISLAAATDDDGNIAFTVEDTGIGIAPEDIPIALTTFGQVDATLSRKFEGAGLGLPLSRHLTEMHGGRLKVESEPGVGTSITVVLPASRTIALQ